MESRCAARPHDCSNKFCGCKNTDCCFNLNFLVAEGRVFILLMLNEVQEIKNAQKSEFPNKIKNQLWKAWTAKRKTQDGICKPITFAPKILFERIVAMISLCVSGRCFQFFSSVSTTFLMEPWEAAIETNGGKARLIGCCWSWLDT